MISCLMLSRSRLVLFVAKVYIWEKKYIQCASCAERYHKACWDKVGGNCILMFCSSRDGYVSDKRVSTKELELSGLESKAIQFELTGNWRDALYVYYKIKKIDPDFPRVEIKIAQLEKEFSGSKAKYKDAIRCPNCGSERSPDLRKSCPRCGSRKIFGGYYYAHEIKSYLIALALVVGTIALILFVGTAIYIYLQSTR